MDKWISVNDRLPEERHIVITWHPTNGCTFTMYQMDGKFYHPYEDKPEYYDVTTHWMPLPDPPKEGK